MYDLRDRWGNFLYVRKRTFDAVLAIAETYQTPVKITRDQKGPDARHPEKEVMYAVTVYWHLPGLRNPWTW